MKKLLFIVVVMAMLLPSCTNYDGDIASIKDRIEAIENVQIPSLQEQLNAIVETLPELEKADKDLQGYITALQSTALNLQDKIDAINAKIQNIGSGSTDTTTEILALLNATKADIEAELQQIGNTIAILQAKDSELEKSIADLKTYIDSKLQNQGSQNWAESTFATLEQYNALATEVATIKTQLESTNNSIANLEARLNKKISDDIAAAVSSLNGDIQQKVKEITDAYSTAIADTKKDIADAYTAAIKDAISALETSMKQWVGEQLSNYYTVAEIEAKLLVLQNAATENKEALQSEIDKMMQSVADAKTDITEAYQKAIADAIQTNNGVISKDVATQIATVENRIDEIATELNTRISTLEKRMETAEGKIATIEEQIVNINSSIASLEELVATLEEILSSPDNGDSGASVDELTALKAKYAELKNTIDTLREYVNAELSNTTDWAEATFATLEQYASLSAEIASLKALLGGGGTSNGGDINAAIVALESTMKQWVGEQLTGYYTIEDMDAKILALQNLIDDKDADAQSEIDALAKEIADIKSKMLDNYQKAIEDAINANNGIIDEKINTINTRIESEVATLNTKIAAIESRLDKVEGDIASIEEQIANINKSIEDLETTDTELNSYIENLQQTAESLQNALDATESKIAKIEETLEQLLADTGASNNPLKEELLQQLSVAKAEILSQLNATKAEIEQELQQINNTISALQTKDSELEKSLAELRAYVYSNINNQGSQDWADATFATLEQYNALAAEVATIKTQIQAITSSIADLETRLTQKINTDIADAVSTLNNDIQQKVKEITDAYTAAIAAAKKDITSAYTSAIQKAITDLEKSMKSWINEQFDDYYTIAEVDAKLDAAAAEFNSKLAAQKAYLEGLINSLSESLTKSINSNKSLIDALCNDVDALQSSAAELAHDIAENATAIAANGQDILVNTEAIVKNIEDIAANKALIDKNKVAVEANAKLIANNEAAIKALRESAEADIAKNASAIAKNAKAIADNSALIAQNATAISNNAAAVAQNSADILKLKQDLAAAQNDITEAYTAAIESAITALESGLQDKVAELVAEQIEAANKLLEEELDAMSGTVGTFEERIAALEKDVKNIKIAIYNIQTDIANMQEQIETLINRIQSVTFVPDYADGKATMYYTNSSGRITAGSATLRYEVRPASAANDMVAVWQSALSVQAVYTQTRSVGDFVSLTIESASAANGILTVIVSGSSLSDDYFRRQMSANVRLEISNGYNCLTSDYVNMVPWTTDTVYIPDANFKNYLLDEFDENSDGEISLLEAKSVKKIDIAATLLQVKSLAGVEYFTNLEELDCSYNRITTLDLSANTALTKINVCNNRLTSLTLPVSATEVDASVNQLSVLDVSKALGLVSLNVATNKLSVINVSQNKSLTTLDVSGNALTALDVTKLLLLSKLSCADNALSVIDLSRNTALTSLDCHGNSLTGLDLTKCAALTSLDCGENSLTAIYLGTDKLKTFDCANNALTGLSLTAQTLLTTLDCSHNSLTQLYITKCAALTTLDCSYNNLSSLDISARPSLTSLDCSHNASLVKLWVKDEAQQSKVAITKDDTTTIYYNNGGLYIPDTALKAYLVNNYDDNGDGEISIAESDNITMVNCSGKGVADLTGLEACTNLVTLNCSENSISTIHLPSLLQLRTLTCNDNPIEHINLDNCSALQYLNLQGVTTNAINATSTAISIDGYAQAPTLYFTAKNTPFTSFTFKNTSAVTSLELYGEFTDVTVTNNTALTSLVFYAPVVNATLSGNSTLEGVDVSSLLQLESLDVQKCKLQSLDVTKNLALRSLVCSENELTSLDVANNTQLEKFYCNKNQLPRINVTANTVLQEFDISDNLLSALNVRSNTALTYLCVSNNAELSMVDVKYNVALTKLYCNGLAIGELNIVNNTALTKLECHTNTNLTTLTCNDAFDFITTHISINKGLDILGVDGSVLTPEVGDLITVNLGIGVVFSASNGSFKIVSAKESNQNWYNAGTWCLSYGADWYFPTRSELESMRSNLKEINSTLDTNGYQIINGFYWSSSSSINYPGIPSGGGGGSSEAINKVRAVLAF